MDLDCLQRLNRNILGNMFPQRRIFRNFARCVVLVASACCSLTIANGQIAALSTAPETSEIVRRAADQVMQYREEFRNLLAKEVRTFRIYDKKSSLKKQRVIVSNFLVYDLSTTKDQTTEFRNVISVDGKPVSNPDDRAVELFEKVARANTAAKELERIQKESLRYDEEIKMFGLTLFQAIALNEKVRGVMDFELAGTEKFQNADTFILKFKQKKPSLYINTSGDPPVDAVLDYEYGGSKSAESTIDGTLWIDSRTFQVVREERKLWIREKGMDAPALLTSNVFEFEESRFKIRTPKHITHVEYWADKDRPQSKHIEIEYDYSAFTRPDVEIIPDKNGN
jgi:hypothetical protein